jgi:hypothetical protein
MQFSGYKESSRLERSYNPNEHVEHERIETSSFSISAFDFNDADQANCIASTEAVIKESFRTYLHYDSVHHKIIQNRKKDSSQPYYKWLPKHLDSEDISISII